MGRIFAVIPTFKEPGSLERVLACFTRVAPDGVSLRIVNANCRDVSSEIIEDYGRAMDVREVRGNASLFWSGLVNRGIAEVLGQANRDDFLLLMNVDVAFDDNIFDTLRKTADTHGPCQVGALVYAGDCAITSGVRVRSWWLGLNRHPFAGTRLADIPSDEVVEVDFLPTRCVLIPLMAVRQAGYVDAERFPHYGGDYEYTLRLRRLGWRGLFHTGAQVECDLKNTGTDAVNGARNLGERLRRILSIKCSYNPRYRMRFVWRMYPAYARVTASLVYLAKTAVECSGGHLARYLMRRPGGSYSGRMDRADHMEGRGSFASRGGHTHRD